jgi:hypothetical protein
MFTPTRILQEELLDEHDAPAPDVERSLRDLRRINRFLGGTIIYRRVLRRLLPDLERKRQVSSSSAPVRPIFSTRSRLPSLASPPTSRSST